ncbi:hypothetical protein TanjilG_17419 [Lupinus angustifolius]|uniref:Expansin-like EG45 domain-containing protein n=1 Tax=Lupinus angustifolius TaxID=3871 RepID=A0A4P1R215_LUPAN|nr:hypothetical protein TanjilG_17419 [Lupinus angustifolius]
MAFFLCFFIFFLASSASASNECVHQSKATYFSKESSFPHGACGYGSLALNLTNGQLAGAVPSLFKNGVGCGACFQVRCNNTSLCTKEGTRVVVTDLNHNSQTDFVLSSQAFKAMAKKDLDKEILKRSIVDIEYKRNHGAVWDTSRVPEGPLQLRMVVTGGLEGKEIRAKKEVLPNDWKNGVVYDTGVQINDTSLYSSCNEGEGTW